jgi:hypothetical protein
MAASRSLRAVEAPDIGIPPVIETLVGALFPALELVFDCGLPLEGGWSEMRKPCWEGFFWAEDAPGIGEVVLTETLLVAIEGPALEFLLDGK